jgi:hypothetical protein
LQVAISIQARSQGVARGRLTMPRSSIIFFSGLPGSAMRSASSVAATGRARAVLRPADERVEMNVEK